MACDEPGGKSEKELWIGRVCGAESGSRIDGFTQSRLRRQSEQRIITKEERDCWDNIWVNDNEDKGNNEMQDDIKRENELSKIALDICFRIHKLYGPGLFESVYEEIFCFELQKEGIAFERQKSISLIHQTIKLDAGFRADVILEDKLLLEIKSIEVLADIHYKQVQTYLKLSGLKLGLLINFNMVYLKDGIKRIINTY